MLGSNHLWPKLSGMGLPIPTLLSEPTDYVGSLRSIIALMSCPPPKITHKSNAQRLFALLGILLPLLHASSLLQAAKPKHFSCWSNKHRLFALLVVLLLLLRGVELME